MGIENDVTTVTVLVLFGADVVLFVQGMVKSLTIFPQKRKLMFNLIVVGLTASMVQGCFSIVDLYGGVNQVLYTTFTTIAWFLMMNCTNFAYSTRIKSLGGYFRLQKLVSVLPWALMFYMIPVNVLSTLARYDSDYYLANLISSSIFSIVIAISEIFLTLVLLYRILDILEYRNSVKRKLIVQLLLSLLLLIVLELLLVVTKFSLFALGRVIRPFTYLIRLLFLIQFFGDLLHEINESPAVTCSYMEEACDES
eukprot:NODE_550_length_6834_cov_0.214402.p4 type:complete len:253 gc:universal NODE_550_length_6834_cov_0.214402:3425-2667(-)